jgi:hypothetical protein
MGIKVGTFNTENLFLRYRFLATERGSMGKKKVDPAKFVNEGGHINMLGFEILDEGQRKNTARACEVYLRLLPGFRAWSSLWHFRYFFP